MFRVTPVTYFDLSLSVVVRFPSSILRYQFYFFNFFLKSKKANYATFDLKYLWDKRIRNLEIYDHTTSLVL